MPASSEGALGRSSAREPVQPIKLYYMPPSPPCRSVMMAARVMGIELELILTNIMTAEQYEPEYLKMNPAHTIPTMDDNGFYLGESRAILQYLVNAYGKDDSLYPRDPRMRALVDHRLNFDLDILYRRFIDQYYSVLMFGASLDEGKKKRIDDALKMLEAFLEGRVYVAGDNMTIADISMVVTITNYSCLHFNLEPYPLVRAWFERMKLELGPYGYVEIDQEAGEFFALFLEQESE